MFMHSYKLRQGLTAINDKIVVCEWLNFVKITRVIIGEDDNLWQLLVFFSSLSSFSVGSIWPHLTAKASYFICLITFWITRSSQPDDWILDLFPNFVLVSVVESVRTKAFFPDCKNLLPPAVLTVLVYEKVHANLQSDLIVLFVFLWSLTLQHTLTSLWWMFYSILWVYSKWGYTQSFCRSTDPVLWERFWFTHKLGYFRLDFCPCNATSL